MDKMGKLLTKTKPGKEDRQKMQTKQRFWNHTTLDLAAEEEENIRTIENGQNRDPDAMP